MSARTMTAAVFAACAIGALVSAPVHAEGLSPRQIYKTYGKAVVLVFATDGSAQGSAGTGSILTKDGQVITNAHVVAKNGRKLKKVFVYLKPDKIVGSMKKDLVHRFSAQVLDMDAELDLALLKMNDAPPDLMTIQLADPDDIEIGDPVVAIGHPETGGLWTLTTGSISSVVADFQGVTGKDVYQTEASVNRGNSGGPLLNQYGHMVGINTSISRRAADGLAITDINFSLKSAVAQKWLQRARGLRLAYAEPKVSPALAGGAVGALAAAPAKPAPVAEKPSEADSYTVDGGDGKTLVVVVEPEEDEVVADDPEFASVAAESHTVSRNLKGAKKPKDRRSVRPKQLTKARPYEIDAFVAARLKEMRRLEKDMMDAREKIRQKSGRPKKRTQKKADAMFGDF